MAREFSKKFYKSKEWKKCREYIFNKYHGICADCSKPGKEVHHKTFLTPNNIDNQEITLGEKNLVLLCHDCHHKRHNDTKVTDEGLTFNEFGELVRI